MGLDRDIDILLDALGRQWLTPEQSESFDRLRERSECRRREINIEELAMVYRNISSHDAVGELLKQVRFE